MKKNSEEKWEEKKKFKRATIPKKNLFYFSFLFSFHGCFFNRSFQTVQLRSEFAQKAKLCSSKPFARSSQLGSTCIFAQRESIQISLLRNRPHSRLGKSLGLRSLTKHSSHQTRHTRFFADPHRVTSFQATPVCQRLPSHSF